MLLQLVQSGSQLNQWSGISASLPMTKRAKTAMDRELFMQSSPSAPPPLAASEKVELSLGQEARQASPGSDVIRKMFLGTAVYGFGHYFDLQL